MHGLPPSDLVASHLWIVDHFRAKYRRLAPRADLEAAGAHGLCEAAARFEPEKGKQFTTYAWNWVKGYMLQELRRCHVVAVPEHTARRALAAGSPVRGVVVFGNVHFDPVDAANDEQEQKSDRSMRRRTLLRLARELEPDLRAVVEGALLGCSHEQIAQMLGLTQTRLEQLYARAERQLAEAFWMEGEDNLTADEMRALVRERTEKLESLQVTVKQKDDVIDYLQEKLTEERSIAEKLTRENVRLQRSGQLDTPRVRTLRKILRQALKELKAG